MGVPPVISSKISLTDTDDPNVKNCEYEFQEIIYSCLVTFPLVTPVRFDDDKGVYGSIVQFKECSPRFCRPKLYSPVGEALVELAKASKANALTIKTIQNWNWRFLDFHERVTLALNKLASELYTSRQVLNERSLSSRVQRTINQLVSGGAGQSGLPITNDILIIQQMFELEIGYPKALANQEMLALIKAEYLRYADQFSAILHTGKTDSGNIVLRFDQDAPKSFVTGQPLPYYVMARNPLAQFSNPIRDWREGRVWSSCLPFVNPTPVPIRTKGIKVPEALARRLKPVLIAFMDIDGVNIYKDKKGDTINADEICVTRTGKRKLCILQQETQIVSPDQEDYLKTLHGCDIQVRKELVTTLANNTISVYKEVRTAKFDRPTTVGADKVKIAVGGLKATMKPVQDHYTIVDNNKLSIDLLVSENSIISKGANITLLYAIASMAGIKNINPEWSLPELGRIIKLALKKRGYPETGRFPVYRDDFIYVDDDDNEVDPEIVSLLGEKYFKRKVRNVYLCDAIVGYVPVMRPVETEEFHSRPTQSVAADIHFRGIAGPELAINVSPESHQVITTSARMYYTIMDCLAEKKVRSQDFVEL